jgi:hypothetical protein
LALPETPTKNAGAVPTAIGIYYQRISENAIENTAINHAA